LPDDHSKQAAIVERSGRKGNGPTRRRIYFEGDSIKDLKASMKRAVDHYLEVCGKRGEEPGRPFTGQLRVRMDSKLHQRAAVRAATSGVSLNTLVVQALEHELETAG
jgi:predicted HicB family RNase H-like nuclease